MAIYHLSVQTIGRGQGRSVVNAAAYRAAEKLYDEHLGKTFSYERKGGVEHREILAPEGAPAWATDREKLWNAVEAAEKRKDARLAREINIALPRELTNEQQVELVRGYAREQFCVRGMVADVSIHRDNPEQPHAHLLLTDRTIGPDGFGKKDPAWNRKELVLDWRSGWAAHANRALERAGIEARIDHRSYAERGIELEPQKKIGRPRGHEDGREIVRERMAEHEERARKNGEKILRDPSIALEAITHQRATFSKQDVGRWLNTHTADAEQFQACLDKVMASRELVELGKDARGNERYTTREMLEVERRMVDAGQVMAERQGHAVEERYREQAQVGRSLSADQKAAYEHILQSGDCAVVQGYAGAGKSYMLGAAREAWEAQGYRVVGGALAGKAAEGLQQSAGIESRSLHSWEYAWSQGRERLGKNDVLVIDEAGMVGSRQLERILSHAHDARAKVVLVGDTRQLQAIEAGAPMRVIGERVGQVTMSDIRRQREEWQKIASIDLAEGKVGDALDAYALRGRVHEHASQSDAKLAIVDAWDAHRKAHPEQTQIILAYRNADVKELNELARQRCKEAGLLGADQRISTERGERDFASGDRIYFLKNDRGLGVLNGSLGTVEHLRGSDMVVKLDDGRRIAFDTQQYAHLDHGYAGTVHKGQGVTVDRAHVLAGQQFDQHAAYVGLSRHRDQVDLHWSREEFSSESEMRRVLGRERQKDVALDYDKVEKQAKALDRAEAKEPEISPEMMARIEAKMAAFERRVDALDRFEERVAKREKEMDALADKYLAKGKQQQSARGAEPELANNRYASFGQAELMNVLTDLRGRVRTGAVTSEKAFSALPEVVNARETEKFSKQLVATRRAELEQWKKDHPLRALAGMEPQFKDAHGTTLTLSEGVAYAERSSTDATKRRELVEKDPDLRQKAELVAQQSRQQWTEAKRELALAEKAFDLQLDTKAKDIGRDLELSRGRDRGRGGYER